MNRISTVLIMVVSIKITITLSSQKQSPPNESIDHPKPQNSIYMSEECCGFHQKNLYMNNGTFQYVQVYSDREFSLFLEQDQPFFAFTDFQLCRQINKSQILSVHKRDNHIIYLSTTKNMHTKSQSLQSLKQKIKDNEKVYYAMLSLYGICKSAAISTASKQIQVMVKFWDRSEKSQKAQWQAQKKSLDQQSMEQLPNHNRFTFTIPATVYCIEEQSITQANLFVTKLYYLFIISIFGLCIHFKPMKKIPSQVRTIVISSYLILSLMASDWYEALLCTYGTILIVIVLYRMFQETQSLSRHLQSRQNAITKTFILVSLASFIPLAIKSHIDDDPRIQQKKPLLYLINIIMLCNNVLFISSLINLTRFRHAFYYFLCFAIIERYFSDYLQRLLIFNVIRPQMFPTSFQCQTFIFALWIIPVCDYFFKAYSSSSIYKFFVLLMPLMARPLEISYTLTFSIAVLIWVTNEFIKNRDLIKIIKYRR